MRSSCAVLVGILVGVPSSGCDIFRAASLEIECKVDGDCAEGRICRDSLCILRERPRDAARTDQGAGDRSQDEAGHDAGLDAASVDVVRDDAGGVDALAADSENGEDHEASDASSADNLIDAAARDAAGLDAQMPFDAAWDAALPTDAAVASADAATADAATSGADAFAATEDAAVGPLQIDITTADALIPGTTVAFVIAANKDLTGATVTWSQTEGLALPLDTTGAPLSVSLPDHAAYLNATMDQVVSLERVRVVPINPWVLEQVSTLTLRVDVNAGSEQVTTERAFVIDLPWRVSTGLTWVPVNAPVVLGGADPTDNNWAIALRPDGSSAAILGPVFARYTWFFPDVVGDYEIVEGGSEAHLVIHADTYRGAIDGVDQADGTPETTSCRVCHDGSTANDAPFDAWQQSGHARIFSDSLNSQAHYTYTCLGCHTVGYDPLVDSGGLDDQPDYADFVSAGLMGLPDPDNWQNMVAGYPQSAALGNVQCDSCHGPMGASAGASHPERISTSADICATCHGAPDRHGRFQQWQQSGHASFTTALDYATYEARGTGVGLCAACHSAQGFIAWLQSDPLEPTASLGSLDQVSATALHLTRDSVDPIACAACHDPHNPGDASGDDNTARVRITDTVPLLPSGFSATGLGRGAVCVMCHNSRQGEHSDGSGNNSSIYPHPSAQADVLLNKNAFFMTGAATPSQSHANLEDTCTACHMRVSEAPSELVYQGGGANHTFKASFDNCTTAGCHDLDQPGDALYGTTPTAQRAAYDAALANLHGVVAGKILDVLNSAGDVVLLARHPETGVVATGFQTVPSADLDYTSASLTNVGSQMAVVLGTSQPLTVSWSDATTTDVTSMTVRLAELKDIVNDLFFPASGIVFKACWNAMLLSQDNGHGAHAYQWSMDVISRTQAVIID